MYKLDSLVCWILISTAWHGILVLTTVLKTLIQLVLSSDTNVYAKAAIFWIIVSAQLSL